MDGGSQRSAVSLVICRSCNIGKETDARGRKLIVHKVPVPGKPVCITEYELAGFSFEEGEEQRKAGERLAASYVNFYITNGGVLIPQFGDEMDAEAVNIIGGFSRKEGIPGLRT